MLRTQGEFPLIFRRTSFEEIIWSFNRMLLSFTEIATATYSEIEARDLEART